MLLKLWVTKKLSGKLTWGTTRMYTRTENSSFEGGAL